MDFKKLAQTLIPDKDLLPLEEYERLYPERSLEKGAEVTRVSRRRPRALFIWAIFTARLRTSARRTLRAAFSICA